MRNYYNQISCLVSSREKMFYVISKCCVGNCKNLACYILLSPCLLSSQRFAKPSSHFITNNYTTVTTPCYSNVENGFIISFQAPFDFFFNSDRITRFSLNCRRAIKYKKTSTNFTFKVKIWNLWLNLYDCPTNGPSFQFQLASNF